MTSKREITRSKNSVQISVKDLITVHLLIRLRRLLVTTLPRVLRCAKLVQFIFLSNYKLRTNIPHNTLKSRAYTFINAQIS